MFGQHGNELPYHCFSQHLDQFPFGNTPIDQPMFPLPPSLLPALATPSTEHDSASGELGYNSSGCSSYVGSPSSISTSYGTYSPSLVQSSMISCHSLHRNLEVYSSPTGYLESETSSIREVLSIGDLQSVQHNRWSMSPLVNEKSIIESMNRATPYTPEEKKERIERYRNKRNLRNFNKKIKYECRKTLADSRPRVRGRFARNDETEQALQRVHPYVEEEDDGDGDDDYNWISILDALSANLMP